MYPQDLFLVNMDDGTQIAQVNCLEGYVFDQECTHKICSL